MNLESAEYNAKYEGNAHVTGTANVTGNWGVRKPGKSLVGEVGQEIWNYIFKFSESSDNAVTIRLTQYFFCCLSQISDRTNQIIRIFFSFLLPVTTF